MKAQLQELLYYYQLSAAEFAKIIGVNASGLSHIINGNRNFLSIDTIIKIISKYPDVSLDWLILGKGEMIKGNTVIKPLFEDNSDNIDSPVLKNKASENSIKSNPINNDNKYEEEIGLNKNHIKKIIVFNSDNTFNEFNPA